MYRASVYQRMMSSYVEKFLIQFVHVMGRHIQVIALPDAPVNRLLDLDPVIGHLSVESREDRCVQKVLDVKDHLIARTIAVQVRVCLMML